MKNFLLFALLAAASPAFAADSCEDFAQERISKANKDLNEATEAFDNLFQNYTTLPPTAVELEKKLTKISKSPDCTEVQDTRFLYDAVSLKLKFLPTQLQKANQILETLRAPKPKFTPQESAAMVSCLRECVMQNTVSLFDLKTDDTCVKSCKVDEKGLNYVRNSDTLSLYFAEECLDPSSGELDKKSVARTIDKGEVVAKRLTDSMLKSWKKYHAQAERLVPALKKEQNALAARIKKQPQNLSCPLDEAAKTMEAGVAKLDVEERGSGTGFYFAAPNGKTYLASARHVPTLGGDYTEPLYAVTKPGGSLFSFHIEPGKYDYENDSVLEEADPQEHPLKLVDSNEQPAFGQLFRAGGFPGVANGKFTTIDCRFQGYGPNVNGGMAYFLHCPVNIPVNGMSGGPLMSEDGRVWGIAVNQVEEQGLLVASPISTAKNGEPKFGVEGTFLTDHCYGSIQLPQPPHRCQVFPGSLQTPAALPNE